MNSPAAETLVDEAGCLAPGTFCEGCGYELAGLGREGGCPECGMAIERSMMARRLVFASPAWLVRLVRALRVAEGAVVTLVTGLLLSLGSVPGGTVLIALGLLLVMLAMAGFTTREPGRPGWALFRSGSRIAMSVALLAAGTAVGLAWGGAGGGAFGLALVATGLLVAALAGVLFYARELALRIPDRVLARWLLATGVTAPLLGGAALGVTTGGKLLQEGTFAAPAQVRSLASSGRNTEAARGGVTRSGERREEGQAWIEVEFEDGTVKRSRGAGEGVIEEVWLNPDGTERRVLRRPDGSEREWITRPDGRTEEHVKQPDGTVTIHFSDGRTVVRPPPNRRPGPSPLLRLTLSIASLVAALVGGLVLILTHWLRRRLREIALPGGG